MRLLSKDPGQRPQAAAEVAEVLAAIEQKLARERETPKTLDNSPPSQSKRAKRLQSSREDVSQKKRWLTLAGGMAVILLLGIIIKITRPDGKTTTVELPQGSHNIIDDQGNLNIILPQPGTRSGRASPPTVIPHQNASLRLGGQEYQWPKDAPPPAIAPFDAAQAKKHQEVWAEHLGVAVETTNSLGMKFRVIPPGEFLMGSSDQEIAKLLEEAKANTNQDGWYIERIPSEGPQRQVALTKPLGFGIYEVTRGQFRQFVEATGYKSDAEQDGLGGQGLKEGKLVQASEFLWNAKSGFETEQTDDHPVVNVSWQDAVAFCQWLSEKERITYRLPTEAEWEYACRAGSQTRFGFGDDLSLLRDHAWCESQGGWSTKAVGQKKSNRFGLFDMHGNVWEWCHDGFGSYRNAPEVNPVGPNHSAMRGGSFDNPASSVRSANRNDSGVPNGRTYSVGFRIVRTLEQPRHQPTSFTWPEDQPAAAIAPFGGEEARQHQEAWAKHLGVPVEKEFDLGNGMKLEMVLVPPGEFLMGSSDAERARLMKEAKAINEKYVIGLIPSEGPQHRVRITRPFWMGRLEVTLAQFRRFVEETDYKTEAETDGIGGYDYVGGRWKQDPQFVWNGELEFPQSDSSPVVEVSWNDATAFCLWLTKKQNGWRFALPSEAQWEYACRAGTTATWHFGDSDDSLFEYAWVVGNSNNSTRPVGQLQPNPFGLYDTYGNACEWCADWFSADYYAISPADDPAGPDSGLNRIIRGGGRSHRLSQCRTAYRYNRPQAYRFSSLGFRLAATMDAFDTELTSRQRNTHHPAIAEKP
jgi:formylglycine-generating enzyme required for sulfatase activity